MAKKNKKQKTAIEQSPQMPPAFYGYPPGVIPVAPPAQQPIQLAPIVQPIAVAPYSIKQQNQQAEKSVDAYDDDDDYDY